LAALDRQEVIVTSVFHLLAVFGHQYMLKTDDLLTVPVIIEDFRAALSRAFDGFLHCFQ
jgi:hypothetical protein